MREVKEILQTVHGQRVVVEGRKGRAAMTIMEHFKVEGKRTTLENILAETLSVAQPQEISSNSESKALWKFSKNAVIHAAISLLPSSYTFEIHKIIHRVRSSGSRKSALGFSKSLLSLATTILVYPDLVLSWCGDTCIKDDIIVGPCCINS